MKISISNIAWFEDNDQEMYQMLAKLGISAVEIAPTRIFPEHPYDSLERAREWSRMLLDSYGLRVSSIQSIWHGRTERVFLNEMDRNVMIDYTKKIIDFAEATGCSNIVFGCPKNRIVSENFNRKTAIEFFRELGEYALAHDCVLALEANPPIYNTNFINTTEEGLKLIGDAASKGFLLNVDAGAMVENGEKVSLLYGHGNLIHHVHISEPMLAAIKPRSIHSDLAGFLRSIDYQGYVSIETGLQDNIGSIIDMIKYVVSIFGDKAYDVSF